MVIHYLRCHCSIWYSVQMWLLWLQDSDNVYYLNCFLYTEMKFYSWLDMVGVCLVSMVMASEILKFIFNFKDVKSCSCVTLRNTMNIKGLWKGKVKRNLHKYTGLIYSNVSFTCYLPKIAQNQGPILWQEYGITVWSKQNSSISMIRGHNFVQGVSSLKRKEIQKEHFYCLW